MLLSKTQESRRRQCSKNSAELQKQTMVLTMAKARHSRSLPLKRYPCNPTSGRAELHSKGRVRRDRRWQARVFQRRHRGHSRDAQPRDIDVAFVCMNPPETMTVDRRQRGPRVQARIVCPYQCRGSDLRKQLRPDAGVEVVLRDWHKRDKAAHRESGLFLPSANAFQRIECESCRNRGSKPNWSEFSRSHSVGTFPFLGTRRW